MAEPIDQGGLRPDRILSTLEQLHARITARFPESGLPTIVLKDARLTAASPKRSMTQFELNRYLDYCAEMLALIGKLAALYGDHVRDGVVIDAVNDIENFTSSLGRKI
jgi:hypothetical protein